MAPGLAVVGASGAIEVRVIPELPVRVADQPVPDDEDFDRRPQRRRYEEPLFIQVRRQLLAIAESVRALLFRARFDSRELYGLDTDAEGRFLRLRVGWKMMSSE